MGMYEVGLDIINAGRLVDPNAPIFTKTGRMISTGVGVAMLAGGAYAVSNKHRELGSAFIGLGIINLIGNAIDASKEKT